MYKPGGTLKDALANIEHKRWVLPAIQRDFVWKQQQICSLFDSLMQGFPFGTFLFWKVESQRSGDWKFYDFVRDYHERDAPHCPELGPVSERALTAVLDGQQRLTALNVGLRGSLSLRRKHGRKNDPFAFPKSRLFLNLIPKPQDKDGNPEDERPLTKESYDFRFMETARKYSPGSEFWFQTSEILKMPAGPQMLAALRKEGIEGDDLETAFSTLDRLHQVIHKDPVVFYYEEESQDLERVLKIFIRLNSQGTVLSQSDLLHSIAVAQWAERDARHEIGGLVDDLNRTGDWCGTFSQSFVLKAGLMLTDVASVGFKVENFTRKNMEVLEKDWDRIRNALSLTARLAVSFGLNYQTVRALSSLLPIAYYLYNVEATESWLTHTKQAADREAIRRWLVASLLKPSGIWGSGLDTLLTALRDVIRNSTEKNFPARALKQTMAERGKSLSFNDSELDRVVDVEYRDRDAFLILSLLYPFIDLRNKFHIDHVFPLSLLSPATLRKVGWSESDISQSHIKRNRIANLQLMDGAENNEKRAKLPNEWIDLRYKSASERSHYLDRYDMGQEPLPGLDGFLRFYEDRRNRVLSRIKAILND